MNMSTNKVYGDVPNRIRLRELERDGTTMTRVRKWDSENLSVDQSLHSFRGVESRGRIIVQEYGRYFGIPTCCLRGGCLTGPNHSGVELHGFLSYLVKQNLTGGAYKVYGYRGKQVRDNIHAHDVARFVEEFLKAPRCAEVYNLGGGRHNSCSILEGFARVEAISGKRMTWQYVDKAREGDHICYISDLGKIQNHYSGWKSESSMTSSQKSSAPWFCASMSPPLVSVCLPNLNTRPYLDARVESICAQTYQNWELIVSDNYSEDGAWAFFEDLARRDRRVVAEQAPREGMYANWNRCIRRARGEFVYIATSDDTMAADCLEKLVAALQRHRDCDLAHCRLRKLDEYGIEKPDIWSRRSVSP